MPYCRKCGEYSSRALCSDCREDDDSSSQFITSAVIGAITDSALLGGLLGGDILGGTLGDMSDGDLMD